MKRLICITMILATMLALCSCSETDVRNGKSVELTFICYEEDISVKLTDEEANMVIEILDGKEYDPIFSGVPSCGFDKDISLKVGSHVYGIAMDGCGVILDYGNLRYFSVSKEDIEYIHSLFKKYGGYFPCV